MDLIGVLHRLYPYLPRILTCCTIITSRFDTAEYLLAFGVFWKREE